LAARRRVIMKDQSRVSGNEAAGSGGGIESERGVVYLSDSARVTGNVAHGLGGGINAFESFVYACPSWVGAISPNTPDDPPPILASTCS
jgi:predicted outer membrane repeat protein